MRNITSEETNTVKELADEVNDDLTVVVVPESKPADVDPTEEGVMVEACNYCGHYPCGCGG